jgi:WD40 repeat protein
MKSDYLNTIKPGLVDFLNNFDYSIAEIAIIGFNTNSYLLQDFTNNQKLLRDALDNVEFSGTSDLDKAFLTGNADLQSILKSARNRTSVILISDGSESGNAGLIGQEMNNLNSRVHSITINYPSSNLVKEVITATSGYFQEISNLENFKFAVYGISYFEKFNSKCSYDLNSFTCQTSNILNINFTDYNYNYNLNYEIKNSQLPFLLIEPSFYYFGIVPQPGQNHTFKLTAVNGAIDISGFVNTSKFRMISTPSSFTIVNGESRDITVRYEPTDSNYIFEEISVNTNSCNQPKISLAGGSDRVTDIDKTLKIIKPNGGEFIASGSQYLIEWQGVLPSDTVQIDYSVNNGSNWFNITNSATGLKYLWRWVPQTPSNNCLLRIKHLSKYDLSKNIISLKGIQGSVVNMVWKDAQNEIYTGSTDGFIRLWNAQTGEPIKTISDKIPNLKYFSINSNYKYYAYITNVPNQIYIININNQFEEYTLDLNNEEITSIEWNTANNFLAAACKSGNIYIWDFPSQLLVQKLTYNSPVNTMKWDLTGNKLGSGYENGIIRIWKLDGSIEQEIKASDQKINSIDFNPTSKVIVSASMSEQLKVWDIEAKSNVINFFNDYKPVNVVSWDPTANYITSASIDSSVVLWQPGTGNKFYTFKGHNNLVNKIHWRNDGLRIASSTIQGEVFIWSLSDIPFNRPTLQEDISDNIWSIINPNVVTKDVIFPGVILGRERDSLVSKIIQNHSSADIIIDSVFIKNASNSFRIISKLADFPFILAANSDLDLKLRFAPKTFTNKIDTLVFFTGAKEYRSILSGFVTKPIIKVEPIEHNFGTVKVGGISPKLNVRITNLSDIPVFIEQIKEVFNTNSQFEISDFVPKFIEPNEFLDFSILFKPKQFFSSGACFDVIYDGKTDYDLINLVGAGAAPQIKFKNKIDLPLIVCEDFYTEKIKIYNNGNEVLNIENIDVIGSNADKFILDLSSTNLTLKENDSTEFEVKFSSPISGKFKDSIRIESEINADKTTFNFIEISAEKKLSAFKLSSELLPFYVYTINTPEQKSFYIHNKGAIPIKWNSPVDFDKFTIESITPEITLPNDSSLVIVIFKGADNFGLYEQEYSFSDSCSQTTNFKMSAYLGPNLAKISCDSTIIFPEIICEKDSSTFKLLISNTGTTPLFISGYEHTKSSGPFHIVGSFQNISIPQSESYELIIKFVPNSIGNFIDTLKIYSNANNIGNGTKLIELKGFWGKTDFKFITQTLEINDVLENEKIHSYFEILNSGSVDINWSNLPIFNYFKIDSISPSKIKPNEIGKVYFTFSGGKFSEKWIENLVFNNLCNSTDSVLVTVSIDGKAQTAIKVENYIGKPGDTLEIPILIYSLDGSILPDVKSYQTTISYNSTLMIPIDENKGYVSNGNRIINYTLPPTTGTDSIATKVKFLITLGNSDTSAIEFINSVAISEQPVRILEINGLIRLDTITTENGVRLIGNSGILKLFQNTPNPVNESTKIKFSTIETGIHKIIIYDILGYTNKVVFEQHLIPGDYEVVFSLNELPIGNYFYRLVTPSQQLIRKFTITR